MRILSLLAATLLGGMQAPAFPLSFSAPTGARRDSSKGNHNPAGSKLARMAREQRVAVKHGGTRLDGMAGIRFRQIHK